MMTDKRDKEFLFLKMMDELNCTSNVLAYNNFMGLCMTVGKPEKVPSLVKEIKQRNIPLTNYTNYIWIQSYRNAANLEDVERVMHCVKEQNSLKED